MNALIFGASGQDGYYLAAACGREGITPIAVARSGGHAVCDVADADAVASLVRHHHPTYVFHLAAHSTTRHEALFEHHATIAGGTLNILEAVRVHSPHSRVFIAGSGVQFVNDGTPISERCAFAPTSSYAVARIQSAFAARYFRSLGIRTYVGYCFHHESPRRTAGHVSKMVALAARRIAAGNTEPLSIGDVSVEKEWTFAGDVADAMLMLVRQDDVAEATIGSGEAYSIAQWLEACFRQAGLRWEEHVCLREGFVPEYRRLVSDPGTIKRLGWRPAVDFTALAAMMMQEP
jgi:GDPmannose 4,6-dehydratase